MDRKTLIFLHTMDVEEQADDVRLDQKLDYENFIDDEVTLLRHKMDTDVTDIPGSESKR